MNTKLLKIVPVLSSSDIARDVTWYKEKTGFDISFSHESMYAGLTRDDLEIHLQWHAGTDEDPLSTGAVIRIGVTDIKPLFEEFKKRGAVSENDLRENTPWGTNEFSFADLNTNLIIISEDVE